MAAALGLAFSVAPPASLAQERPARNLALVIGLNQSVASLEHVPTLKFAEDDASAVIEVLEGAQYEVIPLPGSLARRENIITELVKLAQDAQEKDFVLIYFAGHGVRQKLGQNDYSYWLTYDATPTRMDIDGIRLTHLLDYVNDIPARRKLLVLDHCFSARIELGRGQSGDSRDSGNPASPVSRNLVTLPELGSEFERSGGEGLVVIGAARGAAYEFPDLGHGLFTHFFLKAIKNAEADTSPNDGKVTVKELSDYITKELDEEASRRNLEQTTLTMLEPTATGGYPDWTLINVSPVSGLQVLVGRLEALGNLDGNIAMRVLSALENWQTAKEIGVPPNDFDNRVVNKLIQIRDSGLPGQWGSKATSLQVFIDALLESPQ